MERFTSKTIEGFYTIEELRKTLLILARLNVILCDDDWLRYHKYNCGWSEKEELAEIDDGSGNNMFILFSENGCVVKGFDHESPISPHAQDVYKVWDGMYEGLPNHFDELISDESIEKEDVTFCFWREYGDSVWSKGEVEFPKGEDDGSGFLLGTIHPNAEKFKDWAEEYYEVDIPLGPLSEVYRNEPITEEIILKINPDGDLETVKRELEALN